MTPASIEIDTGRLAVPAADSNGVRCFKGIPYAAPPVGDLRWRAPMSCPSWTGVRATDAFGMHAMQVPVFSDIDISTPGVSEDCLYLNVWTPAHINSVDRLPVMFWIHGGGFAAGHGAEPRYDGAKLAARGILVVTVNYRLNALGFLAHPALAAESPHKASGNWALLDLIAALHWTRRNVAAFGGDPAAVTIAGESAGAAAVGALMASPLAKGLFARAIGQSGAFFDAPVRKLDDRERAERAGVAFARRLGAETTAALRALPATAIVDAAPGPTFRPIIDGHVIPKPPAEVFAARQQSDVPLLAGWNKDEGFNLGLVGWPERPYEGLVHELFGLHAAEVLRRYPADDPATTAASARALGGDARVCHAMWSWIEAQKANGKADIFRFRFERAPLTPNGWFGDKSSKDAGAFHSGEIPYVFDTLDAMPWLTDDADRDIARAASTYWVNFIKHGNPNGPGLPLWPSHRSADAPVLHFDAASSTRTADDGVYELLSKLMQYG
jgi:para-nitrobenzyl esterase